MFQSNERYQVRKALGEGGMGRVYEVEDTSSGRRMALKTLVKAGPLALYLFKNEFRALADVSHPNLVGLYELGVSGTTPWFTMELIEDADDLLCHLRGTRHQSGRSWLTVGGDLDPDATLPPTIFEENEAATRELPEPSPLPPGAVPKLRETLGQLADALAALHGSGKLHRDVKPSNILVSPEGRVVLVDFGLVATLESVSHANAGVIAGSIPYMSPEQSTGAELTPASDWYAFGAVLYECLTGRPPFAGARPAVLSAKRGREVVPPSEVVPGVPADLDELAVALLRRAPAERPSGDHVRAAFGRTGLVGAAPEIPLVGRSEQLEVLASALNRVRAGEIATLHVQGRSGMGKSSLVATALDGLEADAWVLKSRCYERDSLPFKAIDPLVDQLTRWLCRLPRSQAEAFAPRHIRALSRLFPVLDRVEAFAEDRTAAVANVSEERRRALTALRELLARVAAKRMLVVHIDDLQWADRDSFVALRELLRPPDPPTMLLVLSYRSEALEIDRELSELASGGTVVSVGPLDAEDATALAGAVLEDRSLVAQVVEEASGSPFYTIELARRAARGGSGIGLEEYVNDRVAELPVAARAVLETVALAAVPTRRDVALDSSGASLSAITALQAGRLLRSEGPGAADRLECDHDRIREAVVAGMSEERVAECHRELGAALIRNDGNAERISDHLLGAGDRVRAGHYARLAADEARATLAFHREAAMTRRLLDLQGAGSERAVLLERYGDALQSAGRGSEGAAAYLAAVAAGADSELETRAVRSYLWTGNITDGKALAERVIERAGIRLPRSRVGMFIELALRRIWTRLWPLRVRMKPQSSVSAATRERLDTLWSLGNAFITNDQVMAWYLLSRYIPEALRSGDPHHVAQALIDEQFVCHAEPWGRARSDRAYALADDSVKRLGDAELTAWNEMFRVISLVQIGEIGMAMDAVDRGVIAFDAAPRLTSERGWFQMYVVGFTAIRKGMKAFCKAHADHVADARERGDLALEVHSLIGLIFQPPLVRGDPDEAEWVIDDALERWPGIGDLQVFYAITSRARIHLYRDDIEAALQIVDDQAAIAATGALQSGSNVLHWHGLRAQANFRAWQEGLRPKGLAEVERNARVLLKIGPWGRVTGLMFQGAFEHASGDPAGVSTLEQAVALAREQRLEFYAQQARWLIACATDDRAMHAEVIAWMAEQGVGDPNRYLRTWIPDLRSTKMAE